MDMDDEIRKWENISKKLSKKYGVIHNLIQSPDVVGKLEEFIGYIDKTAQDLVLSPCYQSKFDKTSKGFLEGYMNNLLSFILDNLESKPPHLDTERILSDEDLSAVYFGKYGGKLIRDEQTGQRVQMLDNNVTELFDALGKYCRLVIRTCND